MTQSIHQSRTAVRWFLAASLVALVLRVLYLLQARRFDPLFYAPQLDALYHHQWAIAIARGTEYVHDAYFRAPLYPLFLGLVYKVFGVNLVAARVIQAVLGSLSCGLLYLVARRWFSEPIAQASGLVIAVYPLAIYFDGELLIANLLIFLLLLGLWQFERSRERDRNWFVPGLCFGLAAIARPNVLALVLVFGLWLVLTYPGRRLIRLAEFLAAVAVVIAPVTIRNYVVSRRLVLIAWQGGTNFYIGNNRYSDGITAIVPGTRSSWWGGFSDVRLKAEQALGRPLKGSEVDAYWFRQGLRYWAQEPLKALALLGRKCYLWCAGYEVSNNRDIYFFKHYTFLRFLIFRTPVLVFPFGLLLPLALAGCYLSRQGWRRLLPTYLVLTAYSLSFVVFFVTARYRMPVVVLLIPFAVLGAAGLVHSVPRERVRTWILVGAGFLLVNPDWLRVGATTASQNHFLAAKGYYETGAVRAAARELELALARDSAANVLALEGSVRLRLGELDRARQAAQAAVRLWPEDADAWGLAGNIYAQLQEPDLARQSFEQAVRLDPYSIQALNNLGNLALTRRDLDLARSYYEQALQIDPNFTLSLFHLGVVSYYENNLAQARALWERVLELDPQNDNARQALSRLR